MILAMPNTNPPAVDEASFTLTQKLARSGARCDYAVYLGASSDNYGLIPQLGEKAAGLKMYLNETFTTLKLDDISVWMKVRYQLRREKNMPSGFVTRLHGYKTFFMLNSNEHEISTAYKTKIPSNEEVYMCLVVTCWERAVLLALVCGVQL